MEDNKPKTPPYVFADPMTRGEQLAGWIYLPLHIAIIPLLLSILLTVWPDSAISETNLNIFYYAFGCVFVLVFMRKYLRRGFDTLLDGAWRCVIVLFVTYMLDVVLSYGMQLLVMAFGYDLTATPNNEMVQNMAERGYNITFAMAVFMAPLVEEPLFRGIVFGGLRNKSRILAYAISSMLFALYHVWQFAAVYADPTYLIYALSYIPVSIALAYCYEASGSIWMPIGFHMLVNAISISVMGMS